MAWLESAPASRHVKDWEWPAVLLLSASAPSAASLGQAFTVRPPLTTVKGSRKARVVTLLRVRATPSRALLAAWLDVVRTLGESTRRRTDARAGLARRSDDASVVVRGTCP